MAFDPSTATLIDEPPQSAFDPSSAQPIEEPASGFRDTAKSWLDTAMKAPAKLGLATANLSATGMFRWPTDKEVETPLVTPEQMKTVMPYAYIADAAKQMFPESRTAQVAAGLTGGLIETASGLTSPENATLLGAAPEGKLAQRLVAGTFLGQSLLGTPEQWQAFKDAPSLEEKVKIGTTMGLGIALPAAGVVHSFIPSEVPKAADNAASSLRNPSNAEVNLSPESRPSRTLPVDTPRAEAADQILETPSPSSDQPLSQTGPTSQDQSVPKSQLPQKEVTVPIDEPSINKEQSQGGVSAAPNPEPSTASEPTGQNAVTLPPHIEDALSAAEERAAKGDHAGAKNAANRAYEGLLYEGEEPPSDWDGSSSEWDAQRQRNSAINEEIRRRIKAVEDKANGALPDQVPSVLQQARVSDEPLVSRIANRFTEERAKGGELGEIAPGEGVATADLVQRGLKMSPEEINQHVSDLMRDEGNDPIKQAAAVRAEEARLSDRSTELSRAAEANPRDLQARLAANAAFQDLTDFHNGPVAKLKERFHATGMGLQRAIPVDLSTFNGLREAWLNDTGKPPPPEAEPVLRQTAQRVTRATDVSNVAMDRLANGAERLARNRKLPTADEVRARILRDLGLRDPC